MGDISSDHTPPCLASPAPSSSSAPAPGKLDNWFLEWTVPYTTPVEYQGFKMAWSDNITHMLTDPDVTWDVKTTTKSFMLSTTTSSTDIGKYVSSRTVMGMDLSGEGTIFGELSDTTSNTLTYTSPSADSWCVVEGSVKFVIKTHSAVLKITGMKDATVQALIENYVKENQAKLGGQATALIQKNFGKQINKYFAAIMNSICGELPPPSSL